MTPLRAFVMGSGSDGERAVATIRAHWGEPATIHPVASGLSLGQRLALMADAAATGADVLLLADAVRLPPLSGVAFRSLATAMGPSLLLSLPSAPEADPAGLLASLLAKSATLAEGDSVARALAPLLRPGLAPDCLFLPAGGTLPRLPDDIGPTAAAAVLAETGCSARVLPLVAPAATFAAMALDGRPIESRQALDTAITAPVRSWGATERVRRSAMLHLIHGWGGGSREWVDLMIRSAPDNDHFVLESSCGGGRSNREFLLLQQRRGMVRRERLAITEPIPSLALDHAEYRALLAGIIDRFHIDAVMISSLIGHSLDALDTGLPTTFVLHDFFPYCVGLNVSFRQPCGPGCSEPDLARCLAANPFAALFRDGTPAHWLEARRRWSAAIHRAEIRLVAPSAWVRDTLVAHIPDLAGHIAVIPHAAGMAKAGLAAQWHGMSAGEPMRILVLGQLSHVKGLEIFRQVEAALRDTVEFHLIGCGEVAAQMFRNTPGCHVVQHYRRAQLPDLVGAARPHLALVMSVVPETFSLTLSELRQMSIPVVATRLGAIGQRVEDDGGGRVVEPGGRAFIAAIRKLRNSPAACQALAAQAAAIASPTGTEMASAYHALMPLGGRRCIDVFPLRNH